MSISVLVLGAPFENQACYTAYRYVQAALELGQSIHRVFFYQAGVHSASRLACPPRDEFDLYRAWQTLKTEHDLDLIVCIAAAARRGVIDPAEAKRHNKATFNLAEGFELSGLGQLIEALTLSDQLLTFGE